MLKSDYFRIEIVLRVVACPEKLRAKIRLF